MIGKVTVIAEVKTRSPFGYASHLPWHHQFELAQRVGDMISIHTEEPWGGSLDLVKRAVREARVPILAKGIHREEDDVRRAFDAGATYVLTVGRVSDLESTIFEPLNLQQLRVVLACVRPQPHRVLWNARNLDTGQPKLEAFEAARELHRGWLCQASHIKSTRDIKPGANAVLVGEHLPVFAFELIAMGQVP